jgi:hypothetical protein
MVFITSKVKIKNSPVPRILKSGSKQSTPKISGKTMPSCPPSHYWLFCGELLITGLSLYNTTALQPSRSSGRIKRARQEPARITEGENLVLVVRLVLVMSLVVSSSPFRHFMHATCNHTKCASQTPQTLA